MLNWAAYLAYQKDEANTFDPQRATYFVSYIMLTLHITLHIVISVDEDPAIVLSVMVDSNA